MKKFNVISLFDGISVAQQALKNVGFDIGNYYASEIDKYAISVTQKNHPNTIQIGDVKEVRGEDYKDIDLLVGGSPCFPEGTLVFVGDGYKPIEDIVVGDKVLTHNRNLKNVKATGNKVVDMLVNIKTLGATWLDTTLEHPFYVRKLNKVWDDVKQKYDKWFSEPYWVQAQHLTQREIIFVWNLMKLTPN